MLSNSTQPLLLGIIGSPLGHSLSPLLHNWALETAGLRGAYMAWPLAPDQLPAFMLGMRVLKIQGCSVTIPFKQRVIPYLDGLTAQARDTGAVNTLFWRKDKGLWGDNTDCPGCVAPLKDMGHIPDSALILGAGGAALACVAALRQAGVSTIMVAARRSDVLERLRCRFEIVKVSWDDRQTQPAGLLVNATPLGMAGDMQGMSPLPKEYLGNFPLVYDLIYNPAQTRLMQEAEEAGCQTLGGLGMFVHQAAAQFELWTGRSFAGDQAIELLKAHLGQG